MITSRTVILTLLFILICGFTVRLIGIDYGLPFAYHDDEPILVNYALAYGTGDFNPHVFKVPPFLSYLLFFLYGLYFLAGYAVKFFGGVNDFAYLYLNDPTSFYIIGRVAYGLVCGTLSVLVIYFLGKRYFNKETGLLASLFLALNYLHVRDSHYLYFDVPLTLLVMLLFIKMWNLLEVSVRRRDYVLSGIIFGLALSVKYTAISLVLPFSLAILYSLYASKGRSVYMKLEDIFLCALSAVAVVVFLNPFAFMNFQGFVRSMSRMPTGTFPLDYHLRMSLFNGTGMLMVLLGIIGMVFSLLIDRDRKFLLIVYAIPFYFAISRSQPAERLIMPIVPIVLLFSAYLVVRINEAIKEKFLSNAVTAFCIIILIFPSALRVYYSDSLFLKEDTRTEAYNWIKENIPPDSRIALDATASWFPKLEKSKSQLAELTDYFDIPQFDKPKGADQRKLKYMLENPDYPLDTYYLYYIKETAGTAFLSVQPDISASYRDLVSNDIEYVLLSHTLVDGRYAGFVEEVKKRGELIKVITPYKAGISKNRPDEGSLPSAAAFMHDELKDREHYGPLIEIYELKK